MPDSILTPPTPEEVCETIELMLLIGGDHENKVQAEIFRMVHIRQSDRRCGADHADWVAEFRKKQTYWANANKAPSDPTKRDCRELAAELWPSPERNYELPALPGVCGAPPVAEQTINNLVDALQEMAN